MLGREGPRGPTQAVFCPSCSLPISPALLPRTPTHFVGRALRGLIVVVRQSSAIPAGALPVSWGVMAGGENLTGAYVGAFKPGIVMGAEVQFPLPTRRLALRADVLYHWIWEYGYVCIETGCIDQGRHSHLVTGSFDLVARLNDPATRWSPYVVLGAAVNLTG